MVAAGHRLQLYILSVLFNFIHHKWWAVYSRVPLQLQLQRLVCFPCRLLSWILRQLLLKEVLFCADQTLYAGINSNSLALCSDVSHSLLLFHISLTCTLPAWASPTSLSHQEWYPEEWRSIILHLQTLQIWTQRCNHAKFQHLASVKVQWEVASRLIAFFKDIIDSFHSLHLIQVTFASIPMNQDWSSSFKLKPHKGTSRHKEYTFILCCSMPSMAFGCIDASSIQVQYIQNWFCHTISIIGGYFPTHRTWFIPWPWWYPPKAHGEIREQVLY